MTIPMIGVLEGRHADVRATDPVTSHQARDTITAAGLAESQAEVIAILRINGPLPDHDIAAMHDFRAARGVATHRFTPQRLRTARHELTELGFIVQTPGEARTETGRRAAVWGIA